MLDIANVFPLLNARATNDFNREGTLLLEYFQANVTISTNEGDVEVPTNLSTVLGIINLNYTDTFEAADKLLDLTTDGVVTTAAVTVRVSTVSIADGAHAIRGFLVGTKDPTTVSVSGLT